MGDFLALVRLAYSAERAAAYAYRGHAAPVRDPLESGNVEEYVEMERLALASGMREEIECIREMARVEKAHETYFLDKAMGHPAMRWFPRIFGWGPARSFNSLPAEPRRSRTAA